MKEEPINISEEGYSKDSKREIFLIVKYAKLTILFIRKILLNMRRRIQKKL